MTRSCKFLDVRVRNFRLVFIRRKKCKCKFVLIISYNQQKKWEQQNLHHLNLILLLFCSKNIQDVDFLRAHLEFATSLWQLNLHLNCTISCGDEKFSKMKMNIFYANEQKKDEQKKNKQIVVLISIVSSKELMKI